MITDPSAPPPPDTGPAEHRVDGVEIGAWLSRSIPGLDISDACTLIEQAAPARQSLAMLHAHLRGQPDTLTTGGSDCPAVVLRLLTALAAAGHVVTAARCIGCTRSGIALPRRTTGGRFCRACDDRLRAQPCSRCATLTTVHARRDGKPVCPRCHRNDPAIATPCSRCDRAGPVAARTPSGQPLCRRCYQRPSRPCIHCGRLKAPSRRTPEGPVCQGCHARPTRACDRCGTVAKIFSRSFILEGFCRTCWPARHHVACHLCSRFGPWPANRQHDQRKTCPDCSRATFLPRVRECALCSRSRRILLTWPLGPVCGDCYKIVRSHPGICTRCATTAVLVGRDETGARLCGRCCGKPEHDYRCARCGETGYFLTRNRCTRCQAHDRVHHLLADHTGTIPAPLVPFADALQRADSPTAVLQWLHPGKPVVALLAQLAAAREPVTHELLDSLDPTMVVHRLRQTLVHTGVLLERADYLERVIPWLDQLLHDQPPAQAHLIRTYTHWTLLRRARHRARTRTFTPMAGHWLRTRVRATMNLLTWLDTQHLTLSTATQTTIDQWLTTTPTDATYAAREFVRWARQRHLTSNIAIPKKVHHASLAPITDDERWTQLRRCLHDHTLPTQVRAAGALVLLFGLPVSRITTLTHDDIHVDDNGASWLQTHRHRLLLPPAVADLLHTQRLHGTGTAMLTSTNPDATAWLFPGGLPGQPARSALYCALRRHIPVHLRRARSAALAALAAEIPAAVLATLLDLNINTAVNWATYAQHDWTTYLTARTRPAVNR